MQEAVLSSQKISQQSRAFQKFGLAKTDFTGGNANDLKFYHFYKGPTAHFQYKSAAGESGHQSDVVDTTAQGGSCQVDRLPNRFGSGRRQDKAIHGIRNKVQVPRGPQVSKLHRLSCQQLGQSSGRWPVQIAVVQRY